MVVSGGLNQLSKSLLGAVASIEPGPIAVALSGGPDSAIAAWACVEARPAGSVRAVHVDHGWEASARLAEAARAIADQLGISLEIVSITVDPGPSPEGTARIARLQALDGLAGGAWIVTGHHADDSAETMLLNLFRGAGLTGMAGIPEARDRFVRPLLHFRSAQLRQLAEAVGLPFIDDPANQDLGLRRNLVRHRVLPDLVGHLGSDVVENLNRAGAHLAAADGFLEEITPPLVIREDEGALLLPIAPLVTAPDELAARMVRAALRRINPPYPGTSRQVRAVLDVARRSVTRADLSAGWVAAEEGAYVAVYRQVPDVPAPLPLPIPGSVTFGEHLITAQVVGHGRTGHLSHDRTRVAIPSDLVIRAPLPGDRIELEGGTKTVADALGEAAVPRRKRSAWPVVESRARIAWVPGVRVASWARRHSGDGDNWVELERRSA